MKSTTLRMMEALHARMLLDKEQSTYYKNLILGYEGEACFAAFLKNLQCPYLLLHDLYFEPRFTGAFQIDFILLVGNTAIIYEVKNYSGVWMFSEEAYKQGLSERANPTIQLSRAKNNFKALLREYAFSTVNVEAVVVHIGKNFTLLGAPEDRQVILPTQISDHLEKLNQYTYPVSPELQLLAKELTIRAVPAPPFVKMIPHYEFDSLKKGLRCNQCGCIAQPHTVQKFYCVRCQMTSMNQEGIVRAIYEFELLFPNEKITTRKIANWCDNWSSLRSYRRAILSFQKETKKFGHNNS